MRVRAVCARQWRLFTAHAALFGNAVHRQKTHVVRSELVLDARIAEPDDQLHSAYFFFSDFSAFSAFRPCRHPRQLRLRFPACPS